MAMYIFQFGFLQPLVALVNSQFPIVGFTIILLVTALINNRFKIKPYVIYTFIIISIYFLINSLLISSSRNSILLIYIEFILKGFSAFFIASIAVNGKDLYNAFLHIAIVNFIAIGFLPLIGFSDSMNYMRYGYAMVPSVIMFIYALYDSKHKVHLWIAMFTSLTLTLVYGSRGTIVVILIFISLFLLFSKTINVSKRIIYLFTVGISIYAVSRAEILPIL